LEIPVALIENVIPILRVEDVEVSRRYYTQTLGFSLDWDAGAMISVSRDGKSIMLCQRAQGHPGTWVWIGVEDADAIFAEFVNKGAHIRSPPQNFAWAYEFSVEDPDGHVLRFGGEPKPAAQTAAEG
jgi:predicted lactoylglutathione lyase